MRDLFRLDSHPENKRYVCMFTHPVCFLAINSSLNYVLINSSRVSWQTSIRVGLLCMLNVFFFRGNEIRSLVGGPLFPDNIVGGRAARPDSNIFASKEAGDYLSTSDISVSARSGNPFWQSDTQAPSCCCCCCTSGK